MSKHFFYFWVLLCLSIIYALPRLLSLYLTHENPWSSYIYMYTLGGLFFLTGLIVVIKTNSLNLNLKSDRIWLSNMILGFVFFISLHGAWVYISQNYLNIQS